MKAVASATVGAIMMVLRIVFATAHMGLQNGMNVRVVFVAAPLFDWGGFFLSG